MDKAPDSVESAVESVQAAPEEGAQKQENLSFEAQLMELAKEEGIIASPKAEEKPVAEDQPEEQTEKAEQTQEEEKPAKAPEETEDPEDDETAEQEPEKPAAEKEDKLVPLREVLDERGKRKRANERAERAEAEISKREQRIAELERALAQNAGPQPTPDNPLVDIQDMISLDRLERSYEQIVEIDRSAVNDEGTIPIATGRDKDGKPVYQEYTPGEVEVLQRRAERVLRKDIPKRRQYLAQRAQLDAIAVEAYPNLAENEEDRQIAQYLAHQILSGQAQNNPELLVWIGDAIAGYKARTGKQSSNGEKKVAPEKSDIKKIVESAKTKLAPTAPRTRSLVERKPSADLAKKEEQFKKEKSLEAAEAYVGALLSQRGQKNRVEPVAG